jgi:hypothetical protein
MPSLTRRHGRLPREDITGMPEVNPTAVIAECIEKSKTTADQELIADYITEALGILQIDNIEEGAFHLLGSAIADAVADDEAHTAGLLEVARPPGNDLDTSSDRDFRSAAR